MHETLKRFDLNHSMRSKLMVLPSVGLHDRLAGQ